MMVESIHHSALLVTELEKAKDFYGRVLGLKEIERPPFNFAGAWYGVGDGQIHLIVYPEKAPRERKIDTRNAHLALRVSNFHEMAARLEAEGIELVKHENSITGWPQMFCIDPDGNVLELNAASL